MCRLKITQVDMYHISIPLKKPFYSSWIPGYPQTHNRFTQIEGAVAYLNFHFLIATRENGVEHFIDHSPMSIFSRDLYVSLMENHGFETEFVEPGLMKEGLFVGVKQ